jgi:hypothetical protein
MSYDALAEREHNFYTAASLEPRPPPPPSPQLGRDEELEPFSQAVQPSVLLQEEERTDSVLADLLGGEGEKSPSLQPKWARNINAALEWLVPSGGLTASIFELLSATRTHHFPLSSLLHQSPPIPFLASPGALSHGKHARQQRCIFVRLSVFAFC